jgi:hypothetical protein
MEDQRYKADFFSETISMNPVNRSVHRDVFVSEQQRETESTESCSEEADEADESQARAISELARALIEWDARLIGPGMMTCAADPAISAFATFLNQLAISVRPRLELRREVLEWLRQLGGDKAGQEQALRAVELNGATMEPIALYRLMRAAS